MYKQGIEVKRETDFGVVLETPFWFSIIEKRAGTPKLRHGVNMV